MTALAGTVVIAPVVPTDSATTYPTHVDTYGLGGLHTCASVSERDAIPADRRKAGMLASVVSDGSLYRLLADLATWQLVTAGGGGGAADKVREFTVGFNDPTHVLFALPTGSAITDIRIYVDQAWNGIGASVSIQVGGTTVIQPTQLELDTASEEFAFSMFNVSGPADVQVTVTPGVGASAGQIIVRLNTIV